MPALAELQCALAQSLLAGDAAGRDAPAAWFRGVDAARDGLRVHRNTVLGACWNALRLSYPALERWLGAVAFEALAADYARTQPPVAAALSAYGESFAAYVARHVDEADRAVALDLGRFDWAFECTARSAAGFAQSTPLALQPGVNLMLASSLRLHSGQGPVDEWRERLLRGAALPDREPVGTCHWALWRRPEGVAVQRLQPASASLLAALLAGADIGAALQGLAEADDDPTSAAAATQVTAVLVSEVLQAGFARVGLDDSSPR